MTNCGVHFTSYFSIYKVLYSLSWRALVTTSYIGVYTLHSKCSRLNVLTSCNGAAITDINCYFDFVIKWASLHVYLGHLCSVNRASSLVHRPCPAFHTASNEKMRRACDAGAEQERKTVYTQFLQEGQYRQTLPAQACLKMLKHLLVINVYYIAHFVKYLTSIQ